METVKTLANSTMAEIISDLSDEYKLAMEANSRIMASDLGNIQQLSSIQELVKNLSGKIAVALSLSETESDTDKLSELAWNCEALYDDISLTTGQF